MTLKEVDDKRLSVKWRWTLATSLAFFVTYAIFSSILYMSVVRIMLSSEEKGMERVVTEITRNFETSQSTVDEQLVEEIFESSNVNIDSLVTTAINSDSSQESQYMSYQNSLILRVIDLDHHVVYQSSEVEATFAKTVATETFSIQTDGSKSLSTMDPIYNDAGDIIGHLQLINTLGSYHQLLNQIRTAIVFIGFLAVFFSFIFGLLITTTFLQPVRYLTRVMNTITKDPESTERITIEGGPNEFTDMADTYNTMINRMQDNIESQKQFVEDVSHELRTPVAVVEGHLKLLKRWGKDDPEILDESIEASVQEIGRMKSLVQEMLDLSRASQVDIQYKDEKTDVLEICKQAHTNIQLVHPHFDFIFDTEITDPAYVNMYRNHLEQVLMILLDNAVKYSTDRQEVHLSVSTNHAQVNIAVQDFGEGMTEEDSHKIFNRFYRVDKARSRNKGGNGLGLSIAKQLINGYRGVIWADSSLNHGSVFHVQLPLLKDMPPHEKPPKS
ncbi:two-component sensor histidine kinase [Dolosigranulum pigrum]|uniref:Signal transduction histidine-protein kinase ArlS n=1 Tax=Dolosigranulum pigrum TaxID=29394 RepID=A0A1S8KN98_9LACT|nr:HAMP domain-containing histidine kinase [Dolosigranulum pigrum]OOL80965.1 two-component sensor histidine kinase [Dolosigranulum pigrum]QTJ34708.1 HAMP domain-containing histidine kinase [Dolosigranulum pigrum]QTJ38242.1 HAMP domain-containing histidine kinase [Dolosigranulum pigrum]QTJ39887.1 HAMP domain-containing histidine kinase [Dolosigranulum pigrum]QTJ48369.1 HAMP domain-containing histidine kinase [Dolosigranulum pigrum]